MNSTATLSNTFDGTNRIVLNADESKRLLERLDVFSGRSRNRNEAKSIPAPQVKSPWRPEFGFIDQSLRKMCEALGLVKGKERAILDNAAELICSLDRNLRFTDANAAASAVFGYKPKDLMLLQVTDLVLEKDKVRSHLQAAFSTAGRSHFESTVQRADGELVSVAWSVSSVAREQTLYCVVQDITHRKQLDQIKRDYIAMVSHDLRAPLGNIQLVLSLIEADGGNALSQPCKRSLSIARDNTQRLLALVNNLLDVERIDAGALSIMPERCSFKRSVALAIDSLGAMTSKRGIYIIEDIDSNLTAFFDEERIVQVLVNLLSNALKFSPPQSAIRIKVETAADSIIVKVIDQGRGIPAEKLDSIFDRFRQVEAADCKNNQGAGLGLTICKALVEKHGGKIGAESTMGEGSTFWFTLPRF